MIATLGAQFLSALADNALLFAALARVRQGGYPAWSGPLLQAFFVGAYIVLAPFVGRFADAWPKGRVMLYANLVKCAGALGMCLYVNPFLSYALVGIGAAANSPAKYAILSELTTTERLVKANSLLEGSTIAAILLGAIAGGALADWSVGGALTAIAGGYAGAALCALLIPRLKRAAGIVSFSVPSSIKTFAVQIRELLKSRDARLAVIGTALFWGAGAALRFLVIAWVLTTTACPAFSPGWWPRVSSSARRWRRASCGSTSCIDRFPPEC
jgi:LPLT family lysophospholipid transporter-like MFS transporter